jgi:ubiquinone/menaquinone biosynthesis C-methylase UbiE
MSVTQSRERPRRFLSTGSAQPRPEIAAMSDAESLAVWEAAYARFETPEQEIEKFLKRLEALGAAQWPRDAEIVELFCGRGNGLHALAKMGFARLEGVDLSPRLIAMYSGPARCVVADCRQLPFPDRSKEIAIIQGGVHHLPTLPEDLEQTLSEVQRVLRDDGRLVVVEPWLTPFLEFVHWTCRKPLARRLSARLDALATMTEHEQRTYDQWLNQPQAILDLFARRFQTERMQRSWGKLKYVGRKRPA